MAGEIQTAQFDALVAELDTIAKALPADSGMDDENIRAAAEDGGGEPDGDEGEGLKKKVADTDDEDEPGEKPMAKSFRVTLPDGAEAEAIDAGEMLKSMNNNFNALQGGVVKSMSAMTAIIAQQGALLKSLHASVEKLRGEGRGRQSTVAVNERPAAGGQTMAKSASGGGSISTEEFMAKSMAAFEKGALTGLEIATIEATINRGQQPAADLVGKVIRATAA